MVELLSPKKILSVLLLLTFGSPAARGLFLDPPTSPHAVAVSATEVDLDWSSLNTQREGTFVDRSTDGVNFVQLTTVGNKGLSYRDLSAAEGTTYYYRFRDFKNSDVSNPSAIVSARTPQTVPIAPSGLTATPLSPTQVRATWTDGSFNESGFRIDPSSSASGPCTLAGKRAAKART